MKNFIAFLFVLAIFTSAQCTNCKLPSVEIAAFQNGTFSFKVSFQKRPDEIGYRLAINHSNLDTDEDTYGTTQKNFDSDSYHVREGFLRNEAQYNLTIGDVVYYKTFVKDNGETCDSGVLSHTVTALT